MDDTLPVLTSEQDGEPLDAWPVDLDVGAATDRGLVRERNEDHYLVADLERQLVLCDTSVTGADPEHPRARREAMVLAVADGMGGHAGGALASQVVLDALAGYLVQYLPWAGIQTDSADQAVTRELRRALAFCQRRLDLVADRKGLLAGHPGTTLTSAIVSWPGMLILHVGDSRLYLHRRGTLSQLTRDHTLLHDESGRKMGQGEPLRHVLLNAIVSGSERAEGEIRWVLLEPDDALLLCTDGLSEHVTDDVLSEVVGRTAPSSEACAELIDLARQGGGRDNITAVVARFRPTGS
ncbi:MAG TPA: protein phosphatase 2C domain-containing protein [Kofleriaceae bacterium]|nr:protein phosphatase 2C domain-containing protein [Kofleriaceae bacterium]